MNKGISTLLVVVIIAVAILAIAGLTTGLYFWQKNVKLEAELSTPSAAATTSTPTPTKATEPQVSPQEVAENFMNYTLGTLPTANLNYNAARNLMTKELNAQYPNDSSFVPFFYGIQDGPVSAEIVSEYINGDNASVKVNASWGEMGLGWAFSLIKTNDSWLISGFRNDAQ